MILYSCTLEIHSQLCLEVSRSAVNESKKYAETTDTDGLAHFNISTQSALSQKKKMLSNNPQKKRDRFSEMFFYIYNITGN